MPCVATLLLFLLMFCVPLARCLSLAGKSLKKEVFAAFSSDRSDTVGDDVTEAHQRQHPHMHLTGLMFHNCTQKFVKRTKSRVAYAETRICAAPRETPFQREGKEMNNKD